MLGHLGINVPDLEGARSYYDRLLPFLGFEPLLAQEHQLAYRPVAGKPGTYLFFYPAATDAGYEPDRPGLQHLAFMVPTRSEVRASTASVLRHLLARPDGAHARSRLSPRPGLTHTRGGSAPTPTGQRRARSERPGTA
jgi:catechol 2,3-dioxygenase-like lactoylglutathione lyase family enzyme